MIYFSQRAVERPHRFPRHRHVDHELLWPTRGSLFVACGGDVWQATTRFAVVVPAGLEHDAEVPRSAVFREVYVEPEERGGDLLALDAPLLVAASPALRVLLDELEAGQARGAPRTHLERAVVHLLRAAELPAVTAPPMPRDERARRAAELVLGAPASRISLADLGRRVGASPRTLTRLFVADTGMSFAAWRTAARTHRAATLLDDGHSSARVAAAVGYADASTFSRAFRLATARRPSDVRARRAGRREPPPRARHVLDASGWTRTDL